jgi:hypothetical protein
LTDVKFAKVVFTVAWDTAAPEDACAVTTAGSDGTWSCKVDLFKLGAPLGPLTFAFDVFDDAGDIALSPAGSRIVIFAAAPSPPASVAWAIPCLVTYTCPEAYFPVRVTWPVASGPITGYRLYYTPGTIDYCNHMRWTSRGAARLLANLGPTVHSWSGRLSAAEGKYSVVAINAAAWSTATLSSPVSVIDNFMCP